jgi:membrane dipeptidase
MAAREPNLTGKALDDYAAQEYTREQQPPQHVSAATIDDVVANIEHVVQVAGIDHVGIGSDFDGIQNDVPKGLEDASKMPALAALLRKRGHSEADVEKIMGGNFLRVMKQVIGK